MPGGQMGTTKLTEMKVIEVLRIHKPFNVSKLN